MDRRLRELEREAEANPEDLDLLRKLAQISERMSWKVEGKTVKEHMLSTIVRWENDPDEFEAPESDFRVFSQLGLHATASLIDAFKSEQIATVWRAGFALGEMGATAAAAFPVLVSGLSHDHPVISAQSRWTLSRLAPYSLPYLLDKLTDQGKDWEKLLEAIVFMGREARSACAVLDELSNALSDDKGARACKAAAKRLSGPHEARPENIFGVDNYQFGTTETQELRAFEHEVWGWEVSAMFRYHDDFELEKPETWQDPELEAALSNIQEGWRPHDLVLRAPRVSLIYQDYDSEEDEELVSLKSPNDRDFTLGELLFAVEQSIGDEDFGLGIEISRRAADPECPVYFVEPYRV